MPKIKFNQDFEVPGCLDKEAFKKGDIVERSAPSCEYFIGHGVAEYVSAGSKAASTETATTPKSKKTSAKKVKK